MAKTSFSIEALIGRPSAPEDHAPSTPPPTPPSPEKLINCSPMTRPTIPFPPLTGNLPWSPLLVNQSAAFAHDLDFLARAQGLPLQAVVRDLSPRSPILPWMVRPAALPYTRFPGSDYNNFFFPPYRKPKRIRTAFTPSQLLQLERAFERNHYVVGQERKQLAVALSLTETQVKVWFQNRRTKHKRVRPEDGEEEEEAGSPLAHDTDSDNVDITSVQSPSVLEA